MTVPEDESLLERLADLEDEGVLTDWEVGFTENVSNTLNLRGVLSGKQWDMVHKILERHGRDT